jgi:glycerol-3-phosphate acyltransferase PlsY
LLLGAYLLGSIPFGLLLTRAFTGRDVRAVGSGNIGATNVARAAGKKLGVVVLVLDAAKAYAPVVLAQHLLPEQEWIHAGCGLAAFVGHVFPIYLKLRGGKGVASALGAMLALTPKAALAGAALFLLVYALSRIVSLGSLLGAVLAVVLSFVWPYPRAYAYASAVMTALIVIRHEGNIRRMLRSQERKL